MLGSYNNLNPKRIMIRILILLIALNTAFPLAGFASVCASNMSMVSSDINVSSLSDHQDSQQENMVTTSQMHCHDPSMSCNDQDMDAMNCDSGCCVSCYSTSMTMLTAFPILQLSSVSNKPASGYINFYTRSISPELQPPLV